MPRRRSVFVNKPENVPDDDDDDDDDDMGVDDVDFPIEKKARLDEEDAISESGLEEDSWPGSEVDDASDGEFPFVEGLFNNIERLMHRASPEPEYDENTVLLSWYDSDLHLVIDEKNFTEACPLHHRGFCFLQAGVRATHGLVSGRLYFEVKITNFCDIKHQEGHLNKHLIRIGWSPVGSSLAVGADFKSYGFDSNGRASTKGEIKDYGKSLHVGDVIGAYLDLNERPAIVSFSVNGEDQGIAYEIPRVEKNEAMFPHITTKNISFKCNFGSENVWYAPKKGFTYVDKTPLNKRTPGPRPPKCKGDCEMIMMIGLPKSGKSTWAKEHAAKTPGKYYIIDVMNFVDKMELMDPDRKKQFLRKARVLGNLLKVAVNRTRNYILDQVSSTRAEQQWKMRMFKEFQRRAVVTVIPDEEFEKRIRVDPSEETDWLMFLKAKMSLPQPTNILSRIDYVGLPQFEAEKLIKKYNHEAWKLGFMPHKNFIVPSYIFRKKVKRRPINWKSYILGRGRFAGPVDRPTRPGRETFLEVGPNEDWPPHQRDIPHGGWNSPPRMIDIEAADGQNEFHTVIRSRSQDSDEQTQFQQRNRWSRGSPGPRPRDINWHSSPRHVEEHPLGQIRPRRAASVSPPRSVMGDSFSPEHRARRDFQEEAFQTSGVGSATRSWPPRDEKPMGWMPDEKRIDRRFTPPRGRGCGDNFEGPRRGGDGPSFRREKFHGGTAPPHEGRIEHGFPARNRLASFSPEHGGRIMSSERRDKEARPTERMTGDFPLRDVRGSDNFPMREQSGDRIPSQERRMGHGFPPSGQDFPAQDNRAHDNFQHVECRMGSNFPLAGKRLRGNISPPRARRSGGPFREEGRNIGDFPSENRRFPPMDRRNDNFLPRDERLQSDFSPPRDQMRGGFPPQDIDYGAPGSMHDERIPGDGFRSLQGPRRVLPEHERREADKSRERDRGSVEIPPGSGPNVGMHSLRGKNLEMSAREDRLHNERMLLLKHGDQMEPGPDTMVQDGRSMANFPPRGTDSSGPPLRQDRTGSWLPSQVGHFSGNEPLKNTSPERNRSKEGEMRAYTMPNHPMKMESNLPPGSDGLERYLRSDRKISPETVNRGSFKTEGIIRSGWQPPGDRIRGAPNPGPGPGLNKNDISFNSGNANHPVPSNWHTISLPHRAFSSGEGNLMEDPSPMGHNRSESGYKFDHCISPSRGNKGPFPASVDRPKVLSPSRSRWRSRSPDHGRTGRVSPGPVARGPPGSSDSPMQVPRRSPEGHPIRPPNWHPRGSPSRRMRGSPSPDPQGQSNWGPRQSPGRDSMGLHCPRRSPVRNLRGSPLGGPRRSSERGRRSPGREPMGPPVQGPRGSLGRGTRGSPVRGHMEPQAQGPWGSLVCGTRGSPVHGPRGSPVCGPRGSPVRGPGVSPVRVPRGSPGHGSRDSPGRGPGESPGRGPRGPPARGRWGSPGRKPGGLSPDGRAKIIQQLQDSGNAPQFPGRGWVPPNYRGNREEWPPLSGEKRGNWPPPEQRSQSSNRERFSPNPGPYQQFQGTGPVGTGDNINVGGDGSTWRRGDYMEKSELVFQQGFIGGGHGGRVPMENQPPINMEGGRPPFMNLHERLGPKVPDDQPGGLFEFRPGIGPEMGGNWQRPHEVGSRIRQSPHGSDSSDSCWERVPEDQAARGDNEELAPYEQPFNQELWDSTEPESVPINPDGRERSRNDGPHPQDERRDNIIQPPDHENRGNVWTRVGGYVDDENEIRDKLRRSPGSPHYKIRSPLRNRPRTERRWSTERGEKKPPNRSRRSPGRRESPPMRSAHWKPKRFSPYPEERKLPPKDEHRGYWRRDSPLRKRDSSPRRRDSPPRKRNSPPRRRDSPPRRRNSPPRRDLRW